MKLSTGFSRVDFTPDHGAPLGGYGNGEHRIGNNVLFPVCITCTAFKDENGTTALMFSFDICGSSKKHTANFKKLINEKFGISEENIFFSATHSHSAPSEGMGEKLPCTVEWRENKFYPGVMAACENALNDLSECEIYAGKDTIDKMNFVRRYIGTNDKFLGNWSTGKDPQAHHETEPDNEIQVIRFARENKKDIYMVNWQAHPCFHCGENRLDISPDYPHHLRTVIEKELNADAVFVQGAAGNLVTKGLLEGESYPERGFSEPNPENELATDYCCQYGTRLAKKVIEMVPTLTKLNAGAIKTIQKDVLLTVDHTRDADKDSAKAIWDIYASGRQDEAKQAAKDAGFKGGVYQCRDIYLKSTYGETDSFPVWAMNIGDLGFAFLPYEMFDENGMQLKKDSNCKMTFICEQTNESHSYLPSKIAYTHGGYEVYSCKYLAGMSEKLADECAKALNSIL